MAAGEGLYITFYCPFQDYGSSDKVWSKFVLTVLIFVLGLTQYSAILVLYFHSWDTFLLGPSKSPMNFTGHFASHTALNMSWTRVPKANRHGIVFGYRIYYRDQTIPNATWRNITIPNRHNGSDAFSTIIGGLKIYTPYLCKITAFTYKSEGVFSKDITVWTDEYGMFQSLSKFIKTFINSNAWKI